MAVVSLSQVKIGYRETLVHIPRADLQSGSVTLLVGDNGAGKTTLLKTILGEIPAISGDLMLYDTPINEFTSKQIALKMAVVFSKAEVPKQYTVFDLIALGKFVHYPYYFRLSYEDEQHVHQIIDELFLGEYRYKNLHELSDGNLQKAFIGMALAQQTPIILLDEPTTHLDQKNKIKLLVLLRTIAREMGKAILLSSHDWQMAMTYADAIWLIEGQCLHAGLCEDVQWEQKHFFTLPSVCFSPKLILPQIYGEADFLRLMQIALEKNFQGDLSSVRIASSFNSITVYHNQKEYIVKNFSQTIDLLKKLGF